MPAYIACKEQEGRLRLSRFLREENTQRLRFSRRLVANLHGGSARYTACSWQISLAGQQNKTHPMGIPTAVAAREGLHVETRCLRVAICNARTSTNAVDLNKYVLGRKHREYTLYKCKKPDNTRCLAIVKRVSQSRITATRLSSNLPDKHLTDVTATNPAWKGPPRHPPPTRRRDPLRPSSLS